MLNMKKIFYFFGVLSSAQCIIFQMFTSVLEVWNGDGLKSKQIYKVAIIESPPPPFFVNQSQFNIKQSKSRKYSSDFQKI